MTCTIPNCTQSRWDRGSNVDGLCRMHLRRKVKFGSPYRASRKIEPRNAAVCKFEHCDTEAITRGYCAAHYRQKLRKKELKVVKKKYAPPVTLSREESRSVLLEAHRGNPVTQAINWR